MNDVRYNAKTRTLMFNIDWSKSTIREGEVIWLYKLIFTKDFKTIGGGYVTGFDNCGKVINHTE